MKKIAVLYLFLLFVPAFVWGADLAAPVKLTGTPRVGILLNISEGLLSALNNNAGSGFSFRFTGPDKKGFEIPFYLVSGTIKSLKPEGNTRVNLDIGTGYLFINPLLQSENININFLTGLNARYYATWPMGKSAPTGPALSNPVYPSDSPASPALPGPHTYSLGITAGMEVEVPIGRFFSMPNDTICLAGGLSASLSGGFNINYNNRDGLYVSSLAFSLGTNSYGSSLNSLGVRYYF